MFAVVESLATEGESGYVIGQWEHAMLPLVRSEVMFLAVMAVGVPRDSATAAPGNLCPLCVRVSSVCGARSHDLLTSTGG